jgi:hypothetical protein
MLTRWLDLLGRFGHRLTRNESEERLPHDALLYK